MVFIWCQLKTNFSSPFLNIGLCPRRWEMVASCEDQRPCYHCFRKKLERILKSKRFVMKMMSIAAVAYPRYDSIQNADFNGEIGIWPVVATNPARHFSINRPKCTYVTSTFNCWQNHIQELLNRESISCYTRLISIRLRTIDICTGGKCSA